MTKYILVGGYVWKSRDDGQAFCRELVDGFSDPVKVVLCNFAIPTDVWAEKFASDSAFMKKYLPDRTIECQLANPETFLSQIEWANAIFFKGGTTKPLMDTLKTTPHWSDHLEGKTVAGTSAGANALATYFNGLDTPGIHKGLGIVPVQVMVHYGANYKDMNIDWEKDRRELQHAHPELPVMTLAEGEFEVIKQ